MGFVYDIRHRAARRAGRVWALVWLSGDLAACLSWFKGPTPPYSGLLKSLRCPVFKHPDFLRRLVPNMSNSNLPKRSKI